MDSYLLIFTVLPEMRAVRPEGALSTFGSVTEMTTLAVFFAPKSSVTVRVAV